MPYITAILVLLVLAGVATFAGRSMRAGAIDRLKTNQGDPGLTGLAQVSGRNSIPWSERIEIDVRYVDGWTMRRDLAIMLRTARVVLRREGTYKGPRGGFDLPGPGAADG